MKTQNHLAIPDALYEELRKHAEDRGTTVESMIKRILMLGLVALTIEQSPDADLIVRQGEETRIVTFDYVGEEKP